MKLTMTAPPRYRTRIKRLRPQHQTDLLALFLDLEEPCRISRFSYATSDQFLIQHSQRALSGAAWIAGAFVDETLRGVVEVYDIDDGAVEAAFPGRARLARSWAGHGAHAGRHRVGARERPTRIGSQGFEARMASGY